MIRTKPKQPSQGLKRTPLKRKPLVRKPPKNRIVKTPDKLPSKTKLKRIRKAIDKVVTKRKSKGLKHPRANLRIRPQFRGRGQRVCCVSKQDTPQRRFPTKEQSI